MTDPLFSVADKVTLVSGGSRGIGRAIAGAFAERGARVIVSGRQPETLEQTAREISREDGPVRASGCDVSSQEDVQRLVESVLDEYGRIDVLINVAGVNKRQRAEAFTPGEYDFILDINLKGAFFLALEAGRAMLEAGRGSIINIDSLNSFRPLPGVLPYAMSKAGLAAMTRGLATEWGPRGVRVNSLAPGFILTDLTRKLWSDPTMHEWGRANTPLGRLGEVEDLVGTAIFLASDAAAFLTGQVIYVDGGMTAGISWPIPL
ncbi:MAG: glucose 1-dehydrogenase [Planctomycetes bacterium]|nr:glucose 1-dehydrogenase [Planctomycetota bacterium]